MGRVTVRTPVTRLELGADGVLQQTRRPDTLTAEEPLEVRVAGRALTVTMRTPGVDFDLTIGFLLGEGLLHGADDVATLMHCQDAGDDGRPTYNVVDVVLAEGCRRPTSRWSGTSSPRPPAGCAARPASTPSGCARTTTSRPTPPPGPPSLLLGLPDALREQQQVFGRTGGLHAAGLVSPDGEPARGARGRRAARRGRQGRGVGGPRGGAAAHRARAGGERPGVVRADAEGRDGRHPLSGSGVGAVQPRRRAWPARPA
ncbi:hypothetical protein GCM10025868_45800 [Angustibacter aerolatus]|uniref:Urease accessory protein UreD n=1 Tax=Angustibacter aerolatus TaxID=1162965 RepID=A0ABQ6JPZ2_9ACTN|nr:formate dehydrogenase accessory sulfurtransferase FdhD [Angustibacter aerolatus]GMA89330.1 hypothetical protein GCM10025868_45800 [Angustibacter aerolatus]